MNKPSDNIMTTTELLNIHLNNSDLNITNLSAISKKSVEVVRAILTNYYDSKGWSHPILN